MGRRGRRDRVVGGSLSPIDALLAHPDVVRLAGSLLARPGSPATPEQPVRRAAIAVVVRAGSDERPELLLIKRAEYDNDPWSGHVACPGGRQEPRDRDLAETAIRETWEETGIDLRQDGRILGTLDDLMPRTPVLPPIVIRPFVAAIPASIALTTNEEVADAFWVPFDALREQAAWGRAMVMTHRGGLREEDVFRHGPHTVWGLTHRVIRELVERIDSD